MKIIIKVPKFKSHQHSNGHAISSKTGKTFYYKNKKNAVYEEIIFNQIIEQMPKYHKPFKLPTCIEICYYIKIPTKVNKVSLRVNERRELASAPAFGKPDMDNVTKTILDQLEKAGVYEDDKMICDLHLKRYFVNDIKSKTEYCHINIKEVL